MAEDGAPRRQYAAIIRGGTDIPLPPTKPPLPPPTAFLVAERPARRAGVSRRCETSAPSL
eukprot:CAMPEP_0174336226 /NCGR_PEP_ID=MMETSP0810-20121108/21405_1 /TAXON_ID=73025 ORGANISM="Eutreptiella gymnastica-like, Strain CCMP1594" /NCGR_SAMPLE_ID=MMETSP0810 /ASSEMBLY_ACC=CAM_ASM_000659 /LENGTH=59 /DNA_ID=CAMNT_0015455061 /DNA_START=31 /DNA_END=210 /DNA_ORIENTATION=-